MNGERIDCRQCARRATFVVLKLDGDVHTYACIDHKPKREKGFAPYPLDVEWCHANMPDGMECGNPVKFVIHRPFSGISSTACGTHIPSSLSRATHMTTVTAIKQGA